MHKQLTDRDVLLAVLRKVGKILRDRIVHAKFSLLPKLHDRRRGRDNLGQGRTIECRIERHRLPARFKRAAAIGLPIHHASIVSDDKNSTGNLPLGDGFVDNRVENNEARIQRSLGEHCGGKQENDGQQVFWRAFHVCCDST